jgi:hypothetical protein
LTHRDAPSPGRPIEPRDVRLARRQRRRRVLAVVIGALLGGLIAVVAVVL